MDLLRISRLGIFLEFPRLLSFLEADHSPAGYFPQYISKYAIWLFYTNILSFFKHVFLIVVFTSLSAFSCPIWQEDVTTWIIFLSFFPSPISLHHVHYKNLGVLGVECSKLSGILGGKGRAVAHHVHPLQVQEIHHLQWALDWGSWYDLNCISAIIIVIYTHQITFLWTCAQNNKVIKTLSSVTS